MYTQYMFNELLINPAYAGVHEMFSATGVYRNQWGGLEGAPQTITASAHSPLRGRKFAVGVSFAHDKIAVYRNIYLNGVFAYKLKLSEKFKLRFGLQGGFQNHKADLTDVNVKNPDDGKFDDNRSEFLPVVGAGLFFHSQKLYAGVSSPQLLNGRLDPGNGQVGSRQSIPLYITSGYVFELSQNFKLRPSGLLKMVEGSPPAWELNAMAIFHDKYWIGATYRFKESVDFLAILQITEQFRLGYSYDLGIGNFRSTNHGSHEFSLNFRMKYTEEDITSPRFF